MAIYRLFPGTGMGAIGHRIQDVALVYIQQTLIAHDMLDPVLRVLLNFISKKQNCPSNLF